jgi:DNA-binding PadR family transcriptional regulator
VNSEPTTLLQETWDLLILKSLIVGEMHGWGISRRTQQIAGTTFVVKPGSLFPALHRMEEEGWISCFWGSLGTQPLREILPLDQGWTEATGSRSQAMRAHFLGYCAGFGSFVERCSVCRSL